MTEQAPMPRSQPRVSIPKYIAPLITISTSFAVRRGMIAAYRNITGKPAPTVQTKEAPLLTKMAWAGAMAAVVTLVESLVLRAVHEELFNDDMHVTGDLTDGI